MHVVLGRKKIRPIDNSIYFFGANFFLKIYTIDMYSFRFLRRQFVFCENKFYCHLLLNVCFLLACDMSHMTQSIVEKTLPVTMVCAQTFYYKKIDEIIIMGAHKNGNVYLSNNQTFTIINKYPNNFIPLYHNMTSEDINCAKSTSQKEYRACNLINIILLVFWSAKKYNITNVLHQQTCASSAISAPHNLFFYIWVSDVLRQRQHIYYNTNCLDLSQFKSPVIIYVLTLIPRLINKCVYHLVEAVLLNIFYRIIQIIINLLILKKNII